MIKKWLAASLLYKCNELIISILENEYLFLNEKTFF